MQGGGQPRISAGGVNTEYHRSLVVHRNPWACDGVLFDGDECSARRKRGQARTCPAEPVALGVFCTWDCTSGAKALPNRRPGKSQRALPPLASQGVVVTDTRVAAPQEGGTGWDEPRRRRTQTPVPPQSCGLPPSTLSCAGLFVPRTATVAGSHPGELAYKRHHGSNDDGVSTWLPICQPCKPPRDNRRKLEPTLLLLPACVFRLL